MKIVFTDAKTISSDRAFFKKFDDFGELVLFDNLKADEVHNAVKDADAIICNKTVFNENNLKDTKVKYIGLTATGFNNIDTEYCKENHIVVSNAGVYSTKAVAQHTFALILEIFCKTSEYINFTNNGGWKRSITFTGTLSPTYELAGKTIGIVGYGSIGKEVAKIAKAFDMKVLAYNRSKTADENAEYADLETIYKDSDIITAHCPLNAESDKMFNAEVFSKMKKSAVFINTSRGGVMNEQDLAYALKNHEIRAAGIDVLTHEPMEKDCPLHNLPNCIVTPHVAWAMEETKTRLMDIVFECLQSFSNGKPINVVNK